MAQETDLSRAGFERLTPQLAVPGTPWLDRLRRDALARFEQLGLPTTRDEEWKYTNPAPIAKTAFRHAVVENGRPPEQERLGWLRPGGELGTRELVFVNGRPSPELSTLGTEEGVRVVAFREALVGDGDGIQAHLGRAIGETGGAFAALNTAFHADGVLVEVEANRAVQAPIHLVFFTTSAGAEIPLACFPRTLVLVRRGGQATLVESHGGPEGALYFSGSVTEVVLEEGARLDHYKVQRESQRAFHVASLGVRQGQDSSFSSHSLGMGGAIVRNDIGVTLAAPGGECVLNGLFVAGDDQLMDTHTSIDHAAPHCSSRELYKGVLDGCSQGVFHGRIVVRPGAQKTDAEQANRNLLLSAQALVNSTPQLLIFADDVRCKHAATTGQIDPAALFYLRSRGIGEQAARGLLTYAFASDIIGRIQVPAIRDRLDRWLRGRLPSGVAIGEAIA